jgi:hypothetical protein
MGAERWENLAPWDSDPVIALRKIQASYLAENYNFPQVIDFHLKSKRETVELVEEDGDEYGVLNIYKSDLEYLEKVASRPLPTTPKQQITILRKIYASGGQGIGNILDIERVTAKGGLHVTRRLNSSEVMKVLGTIAPTINEAKQFFDKFASEIDRGDSVCFPVYDENSQPCGWWFAGYTID